MGAQIIVSLLMCVQVLTVLGRAHPQVSTALPLDPPPTPPAPRSGCVSDVDCNYNGVCTNRNCVCDRAWWGDQCATLTLQPSNKNLGYHGFVNGSRASSWGGSVVIGDDGTYHMYAAEITGSCGMNVWLANSQVIHATSPDPLTTPFTRQFDAVVAEVFAHEPIARRAPTGEYVVWYTAVLPPLLPPVNGGQRCHGCHNGTSPAKCGTDANRNATTNLPTYMVWSSSPSGPWSTPLELPFTNVFADSNFAPVINNNGSLVALMRKSVVAATNWKDVSSYKVVGSWQDHGEDPYVYLDRRGVYHNIVHIGRNNTHGLHYYSVDGVEWTAASSPAYNNTITFSDGSSVELACRERPHIVQDKDLNVIALTNGAAPLTCHTAGGDDYAFTSLQAVALPT
eukprot:m.69345 g.69345  ORF g.69345 m.69345 type:complete len:396 (-) comp24079_c0_seq2:118-1305(-)